MSKIHNNRDKNSYNGRKGNSSLLALFNGASFNISTEEIYSIDYNSSIYQFQAPAYYWEPINVGVVETALFYIFGLDGSKKNNSQLQLPVLSSSDAECVSFVFRDGKGAKSYKIKLQMFTQQGNSPSFKGFMSLPNQVRSFERFPLFNKVINLPENKETSVDYLVYSLKFLQKRTTAEEPCMDAENYDKVILTYFPTNLYYVVVIPFLVPVLV